MKNTAANPFRVRLTQLAGAFALVAIAGTALAQSCPHGALDVRFCDADGDLVADVPKDKKQWVNPSSLIFAY
ncbi:MAG: hypothetical protein ABIH03_02260, partial [Pseudomonadota bacterium]